VYHAVCPELEWTAPLLHVPSPCRRPAARRRPSPFRSPHAHARLVHDTASPAHSASGNAAAVVAGKDTSARERLPPAAGPRAQVKFDVLEERSGDGAAGGIGALGGDASSKASSRVESRAASQVAFERLPEKDEALGNVASPSLSDPIGVAVERAEVMGSDEDNEDARDSPLMRRMTTKKRSEARMVRAPDIPTIETGSGQFDSGRMAEITAAAKKEAAERKLLEARSLQLAQKLAAEDEDEEEDESNSVSFGAWGRGGGGGGSAAPAAGASGRGRGGASSGRSRLAEVVGSTDAVNLGSASISSEDRGPPPLPPLQPLQPASRGKRGGFADDDTLRLSGAAAALLKMEHADDLNDSNDLSSLAPPSMGGPTPAPSGKLALSTRPSRYTDLSFSDSDDEDGGKPFDLPRWRKFYAWNRNKQADLTEFLWRRFDPRTNSMFVVTYAAQDAIFAGYQGDNAMVRVGARRPHVCTRTTGACMHACISGIYSVVNRHLYLGKFGRTLRYNCCWKALPGECNMHVDACACVHACICNSVNPVYDVCMRGLSSRFSLM